MAATENFIDVVCRLCASESKSGITIYSTEGHEHCLEEKIISCLRIEVSQNDMLPKKVCSACHSRLDDYHKFTEEVNRVQHTLELLIKNFTHSQTDEDLQLELEPHTVMLADSKEDSFIKNELEVDLNKCSLPGSVDEIHHVDLTTNDCQKLSYNSVNLEESRENSGKILEGRHHDENFDNSNMWSSSRKRSKRKLIQAKRTDRSNLQSKKSKRKSKRTTSSGVKQLAEDTSSVQDENKDIFEDDGEDFEENSDEGKDEFSGEEDASKEDCQNIWGIKCNMCNIVLSFKSHFDSHYRNTYNTKPVYTCSFCNKTMEKYSTFRSHCYRHITEGRYRCQYCDKGFSLRSMLDQHVLAKHTEVKPFICESCGKGFVTQSSLNNHLKKHQDCEKQEFPCTECGKILYTRGGLTSHMNAHKLGRRFMCDLCGKTFTQKVNMQHHVKLHSGERPFACDKCDKCFAEKSHLNRHYSYHSEMRPFKCPVCSKMYKTERCLKVHNMVHAQARPYVCTYCNKGFLSITKLKQHCNIHTGERPYVCKYCDRTFTNFPNWLKHTRRRHKVDHRTGLSISMKEPAAQKMNINPENEQQKQQQQLPHHNHHQQQEQPLPVPSAPEQHHPQIQSLPQQIMSTSPSLLHLKDANLIGVQERGGNEQLGVHHLVQASSEMVCMNTSTETVNFVPSYLSTNPTSIHYPDQNMMVHMMSSHHEILPL